MNILGITPGEQNAVSYFRFMLPFNNLIVNHKEHTVLCLPYYRVDFDKLDGLFDVIHIHSSLLLKEDLIVKLLRLDCAVGIDYDDYWIVPKTNPHWKDFIGFDRLTVKYVPKFDFITSTTKLLATELKKLNKNVYVLPNHTDSLINQFKPIYKPSNRFRVGLITGASHSADIELLDGLIESLGEYNNSIQWVLGGFNVGSEPKASPYVYYERILTADYDLLDKDYELFLKKYSDEPYPYDEQYKRLWAKDIHNYAYMFTDLDVVIAPLLNNTFNSMKSELKVIEAGTFGKVFIGSNVGQYSRVVRHNETGLLCNRMEDFSKSIKRLINEDGLYAKLQRGLYDDIKSKYNANDLANKRIECYEREGKS